MYILLRNKRAQSTFQRAMVKSAVFLRLGSTPPGLQGYGASCTATGQQKHLMPCFGRYSNCIPDSLKNAYSDTFQHLEIYQIVFLFRLHMSLSFPKLLSQKKPRHWRIIQTFSFFPQRWIN